MPPKALEIYKDCTAPPDRALELVFNQAKMDDDCRVKLVKLGITSVMLMAMQGTTSQEVDDQITLLIPWFKVNPTSDAQDVIAKKKMQLVQVRAAWIIAKKGKDAELGRAEKMKDNPNLIPEMDADDKQTARVAYNDNHTDQLLAKDNEPHDKFLDVLQRDNTLHEWWLENYPVGEIYLRSDYLKPLTGFSQSVDKFLQCEQKLQVVRCSTETEVLTRINALMIALEMLQIRDHTYDCFTREYQQKLIEFNQDTPGIWPLIQLDKKCREKVKDIMKDGKSKITVSAAFQELVEKRMGEIIRDVKLENSLRDNNSANGSRPQASQQIDLTKVSRSQLRQALRRKRSPARERTPERRRPNDRDRDNDDDRDKGKRTPRKGDRKGDKKGDKRGGDRKGDADTTQGDDDVKKLWKEWNQISAKHKDTSCRFFNVTKCTRGDNCNFKHSCGLCGGNHPYKKCFKRKKK